MREFVKYTHLKNNHSFSVDYLLKENIQNKYSKKLFLNVTKILTLCLLFTMSACSVSPTIEIPLELAHEIDDVRNIPQNPMFFLTNNHNEDPHALLISYEKSIEETNKFRNNFFRAWQQKKPMAGNIKYFTSMLKVPYEKRGYAENLQKWTNEHFALLAQNANYQNAPSMSKNAITTTATALRSAPTKHPYFYQPKKAGKAYPFDMFQNSSLSLGVPVTVFHESQDGQWYYVESASAGGWVFARDLAFVDSAFIAVWKNSVNFAAITQDDVKLIADDVQALVSMGAILPIVLNNQSTFTVSVPYRDVNGNVDVSIVDILKSQAVQQPLPLTAENVALLGNHLMGNLYGWGGLYGNRDCSSTLQDVYSVFGIWLPRNSRTQAQQGEIISLKNLSNKEKEKEILEKAVPFQTFIFLPGHIGLYIGQYDDKAVFLHNMWGIRLKDNGRFVIGKTVITSLYPGMENPDAVQSLMKRVQSFNIIAR